METEITTLVSDIHHDMSLSDLSLFNWRSDFLKTLIYHVWETALAIG